MKNYPQERKNSNAPQSAPSMAFEAGNKVNANRENGSPTKQQPTNYTPKNVSLALYTAGHNKTCVYLLFQYCDCYYGDEGTGLIR